MHIEGTFIGEPRLLRLVAKDIFVDICLHGMMEDYHVHLENLFFCSSFLWLMKSVRRMNESVRRIASIVWPSGQI